MRTPDIAGFLRKNRIWRELGLLLMALAVAGAISSVWFRSKAARDYYQCWAVTRGIEIHSITNIYSPEACAYLDRRLTAEAQASRSDHWRTVAEQGIIGPTGTPFLYSIFKLLSRGNYDADYERYRILSILGYAAAIVALARLAGFGPVAALVLLGLFTVLFYPFQLDALVGNVNQPQLAVLVAAIALAWTRWFSCIGLAGGLLGAAVCFKPNIGLIPFLWGIMWMLDRQYARSVVFGAGFLVGAMFGITLPDTVLGPACSWADWGVASHQRMLNPVYVNDSFIATIAGLQPLPVFRMAGLFIAGGTVCFLILTRRSVQPPVADPSNRRRDDGRQFIAAAYVGFLGYVLASPFTHGHYFMLLIPGLIFLFRPADAERQPRGVLPRHVVAGIAFILMGWHPVFRGLGLTTRGFHSLWTYAGAILAGSLIFLEWGRIRMGARQSPMKPTVEKPATIHTEK